MKDDARHLRTVLHGVPYADKRIPQGIIVLSVPRPEPRARVSQVRAPRVPAPRVPVSQVPVSQVLVSQVLVPQVQVSRRLAECSERRVSSLAPGAARDVECRRFSVRSGF